MNQRHIVRAGLVAVLLASLSWLLSRTVLADPDEESAAEAFEAFEKSTKHSETDGREARDRLEPPPEEIGKKPDRSIADAPAEVGHRAFLDAQVVEGVTLEAAVLHYLAGRARSEPIRIRSWSVVLDEKLRRYTLEIMPPEGESEKKGGDWGRLVVDYDTEEKSVSPEGRLAERLWSYAETEVAGGQSDVLPTTYVADPADGEGHWTGRPKIICKHSTDFADNCRTMEAFFDREAIISSVGWLIGAATEDEQFSAMRQAGDCRWTINSPIRTAVEPWASHRVVYACGDHQIRWNFNRESGQISALDDAAHLVAAIRTFSAEGEKGETVTIDLTTLRETVERESKSSDQ